MGNGWDAKVTGGERGSGAWHSLHTRSTRVSFLFSFSICFLSAPPFPIHGSLPKQTSAYPFNTYLVVLPGPVLQG